MNEAIDTMEAGRDLDVLILCKVLGFRERQVFYQEPACGPEWPMFIPSGKPRRTHMLNAVPVPRFSTNTAAALELLETWPDLVELRRLYGRWRCALGEVKPMRGSAGRLWQTDAETLSLAICRCVLLAAQDGVRPKARRRTPGRGLADE
jgi:hypothetical protein